MTITGSSGDIAVVGIACRFPGDAKSPEDFFSMLIAGRSGWQEIPKDRFNVDAYWHPSYDRLGSIVCRGGHFLKEDIGVFDAPFFTLTAAEAAAMDPQHRMLLEVSYEALENAGIPLQTIAGSEMACFVGGFTKEYDEVTASDLSDTLLYATTGNGMTMMSNRISWFYDLRGPSMTIDTACSSSLVALHQACSALRSSNSACRQALVAGANLILVPDQMATMNPLHFLSPDSQCFTFDDRANGYVRGEGVGVVVLKHIDDAIRDRDCIRAVIRSTGVNQDGKTPGITLPSSEAQKRLIEATYAAAKLDIDKTTYFEAHGTGTAAGDPLEVGAIAEVFKRSAPGQQPLIIGSVKPNVGHLEAGAGMAGLIKTILALEKAVIPPQTNFVRANPKLRLAERNLIVPTQPTPWSATGVRRASVNSFGYGGTNAHAILDDAFHYLAGRNVSYLSRTIDKAPIDTHSFDAIGRSQDAMIACDTGEASCAMGTKRKMEDGISRTGTERTRVFVLSAPDQQAISRIASQLVDHLEGLQYSVEPLMELWDDLAMTLASRRTAFQWRHDIVASTLTELLDSLRPLPKPIRTQKDPGILFCFSGQGAQWYAMGRELSTHRVYRASLEAADKYLAAIGAPWSLIAELHEDETSSRVNSPELSQPLCTAIQLAMVDLLKHWGISPSAVVGHSSGDIAAGYALEALSVQDCLKIAYHRGRLASDLKKLAPNIVGSMMAVGLSANETQTYINLLDLPAHAVLGIACINSPFSVTVSGDGTAIDRLYDVLKKEGAFARKLVVENAYHSAHMHIIADAYRHAIRDVHPVANGKNGVTMFSSVTGRSVQAQDLGSEYWVSNMINPVLFSDAVTASMSSSRRAAKRIGTVLSIIIEIGPHSALAGPIRQILKTAGNADGVFYTSFLKRGVSGILSAMEMAGSLWCRGVTVVLDRVNSMKDASKLWRPLTNLPSYPWNHRDRYWHESSLSKSRRFRHGPRTDLLGEPVREFTWQEPVWKNYLRVSELPWMEDHKIRGIEVFPAAGMMCAALEAIRQIMLGRLDKQYKAYELRDVVIGKALVVPDADSKIEVFTKLKPLRRGIGMTSDLWYEFSFSSLEQTGNTDRSYVIHASGLVGAHQEIDEGLIESTRLREAYENSFKTCLHEITADEHYLSTELIGITYGPTFRGFQRAMSGDGQANFTLQIQDTKALMPETYEYPFLIHPTTLDAAIQTAFQALKQRRDVVSDTMVPTGFESILVASDIPNIAGTKLIGLATATWVGFRDTLANVNLSVEYWPKTLLTLGGMTLTGLGDSHTAQVDKYFTSIRKIAAQIILRPDPELLLSQCKAADQIYGKDLEDAEANTLNGVACTKATAIYIQRALKLLTADEIGNLKDHFPALVSWMRKRHEAALAGTLPYQTGDGQHWLSMSREDENTFLEWAAVTYPADCGLLKVVGDKLHEIITGQDQPLPIMLEDDMLGKIYADGFGLKSGLNMFKNYFDLQGYHRPDMKILEVGAGTGSITLPIIKTLLMDNGSTPRFDQYCFTDISTAWFEKAKDKFRDYANHIDFKLLDIEGDLIEQGFEPNSFDIIAASNVLHATKRLQTTLANCFKLLKPGGRIVIGELTWNSDHIGLIFGCLPGWWLAEDGRQDGPLITQAQWKHELQLVGFVADEQPVAAIDSYGNPKLSMILARKPLPDQAFMLSKVTIVKPTVECEVSSAFTDLLVKGFSCKGSYVTTMSLKEAAAVAEAGGLKEPDCAVISLSDATQFNLADCEEPDFEAYRSLITLSSKLFWVAFSVQSGGCRFPNACAVSGLLRAAKSENPRLGLYEIHLMRRNVAELPGAAAHVMSIVNAVWATPEDAVGENEYVEVDGIMQVPRIIDDVSLNKVLQRLEGPIDPEIQLILQTDRALKLTVGKPGTIETLFFDDDPRLKSPLGGLEIEIDVRATCFNNVDLDVATGVVPGLDFGFHASGVVKQIGQQVQHFQIGDPVAFIHPGSITTIVRVSSPFVHRLPERMSFEDGAAIPLPFAIAYQSLVGCARLQRGESVLIHGAAGGIGQAMVSIAQHIGANVFATCSLGKAQVLVDVFGLPRRQIFDSRVNSWWPVLKQATATRGIDVVVSHLGDDGLENSLRCLAPFGRFINLNRKIVRNNQNIGMRCLQSGTTITNMDLQLMLDKSPAKTAKILANVFGLFHDGALNIPRHSAWDASELSDLCRTMQSGTHVGVQVIRFTKTSRTKVMPRDNHPLQFRQDSTYVLVGGLGGIGRALSIYMARHGARHLGIFSRSEDVAIEARKVLDQLRDEGVNVRVYACDVSSKQALTGTLQRMTTEMPPIKGVVQGAMALKDGIFESMPHASWTIATKPKIQGTWNLHEMMPKDLDFFIMLSSIAGIVGTPGQSNYSAGGAFQDAFASYRRNLGLTATTIDLGAIGGFGWLAENADQAGLAFTKTMAQLFIQPKELFAIFKSAVTGYSSGNDRVPVQILTGLASGGMNRANLVAGSPREYFWLNATSRFAYLRQLDAKTTIAEEKGESAIDLKAMLSSASSIEEASTVVQDSITAKLARAMNISAEEIDVLRPVSAYGVDSLVAAEMRNWCFKELKAEISVFEFLSSTPLAVLSSQIAERSSLVQRVVN